MTPRFAIVGAGPAGMAAALAIAHEGAVPVVLDAQRGSGGQIWRGGATTDLHREFNHLVAQDKIDLRLQTTVVDAGHQSLVTTAGRIGWDRLILATGARELFLPFPGWTEPGVMGAGGLQAACKAGLNVKGKRIILAGSGPLLLAVAAALLDSGASVLAICEQAPFAPVARFGLKTALGYGKLGQALDLGRRVAPLFRAGAWIEEAVRDGGVLRCRLNRETEWREVDYLGVGFGLVPNLELATLLDCQTSQGRIKTDADLRTSQPHIWAAGEAAGVGGVDSAIAEGLLSARAALDLSTELARAPVEKWRRYQQEMERVYALRSEVRQLAQPGTIVCRCEQVSWSQIEPIQSPAEAKLDLRVGMGWCQGRICGAACRELKGWPESRVRPPLFPIGASQYANLLGSHDES